MSHACRNFNHRVKDKKIFHSKHFSCTIQDDIAMTNSVVKYTKQYTSQLLYTQHCLLSVVHITNEDDDTY